MSSFTLKVIACITMLIDHLTAVFLVPFSSSWNIGRGIGRLAFPIFAFLLVEGFHHTHDVKKYLVRLGIFSILSEFPFDYAFSYTSSIASAFSYQNIYFTLFLGLAAIAIYDQLMKKYFARGPVFNLLGVITIVGFSFLATMIKADYSFLGIMVIMSFYIFRSKRIIALLFAGFLFIFVGSGLEVWAALSMGLLWFYNGKPGPKKRSLQYVFYVFYPAHLLIIGIIQRFIVNNTTI